MPAPPTHAGEHQRLPRRQLAARQRPPARARHQRVDVLLDQAVDRGRRAGHQPDAERAASSTAAPRGTPGTARNMPITAQNTISYTTRGLVSAKKARKRWAKLRSDEAVYAPGRTQAAKGV